MEGGETAQGNKRSQKEVIGLRKEVEFWKLMLIKSRFKNEGLGVVEDRNEERHKSKNVISKNIF